LFLINQSISRHAQNYRHIKRFWRSSSAPQTVSIAPNSTEDGLLAALDFPRADQDEKASRKNSVWIDAIGALSFQKAQMQSPAFSPSTGAVIAAFEAEIGRANQIGAGAAYSYTHTHEKEGAGHNTINQEYLFFHGLYNNQTFYMDATVIGGLFQIHNTRDIHMTGFRFKSQSKPWGWQIAPHLELGGDFNIVKKWLLLEPFVMADWANNWQRRYKETGSGAFNMGQKDHYSSFLRTELGFRFYETISFDAWRLLLKEKASYLNKKPFGVGTVNSFLVGSPGSFTVETLTTTQNLGVAEMELLFEPLNPRYPYGAIAYQGEFGKMYQSHQITLEASWSF
jgi:outer membrane autotransporter protein